MSVEFYTPKVNVTKEIAEISKDFTTPRELIREAIANSIDASAESIIIRAYKDDSEGEDELVIQIIDNGIGMTRTELEGFFDLGVSNKRNKGNNIGHKGHGSKITYNSTLVTVCTKSIDNGLTLQAVVRDPKRSLAKALKQEVSPLQIEISQVIDPNDSKIPYVSGTFIEIRGYESNNWTNFSHGPLVDYIQWFTAWGNVSVLAGKKQPVPCELYVQGIGETSLQKIPFGHQFPKENYDFKSLKLIDERRPENYFVRQWISPKIKVEKHITHEIEIFFSVEGDGAKRESNIMLNRTGRKNIDAPYPYEDSRYSINSRYGIYLCKDYTPIQRVNERFAEGAEWTKWHAFINCQAFSLTANRSNVDNTKTDLLDAIYLTAKKYIDEYIINSNEYDEFARKAKIETGRRKSDKEKRELSRRFKEYQHKSKYIIELDDKKLEFVEPTSEQAVVWLSSRLSLLWPETFPLLKVIDIDAHFGYDLVILQENKTTGVSEPAFVELKYNLNNKDVFNHAFDHLAGIVCWNSQLQDDDVIVDIQDKKRIFKEHSRNHEHRYRKFYLIDPDDPRKKIDVLILEIFMREFMRMQKTHFR